MTYATTRAASGAVALDADFYDLASVEGLRGLEGAGHGEEVPRPLGLVAGSAECRTGKLSAYTLRGIETEAEHAARDNRKPIDACAYPWGSPQAQHWLACFILAGGALQ